VKHENGVFVLDILIYARDSQGLSDVESQLKVFISNNVEINS